MAPPPRGSKPLKGSSVPKKLREWGMDDELWAKIDNKRNLIKMMNRDEESFARPRIIKLRQMLMGEQETGGAGTRTDAEISEPPEEDAAEADEGFVQFLCPAELGEGRAVRVQLEDGREFEVVVPDGVAEGEPFLVGPFPSA